MAAAEPSLRPDGPTESFVQLLSIHQRRIYQFILALVPQPADAEEILQETNVILWRKFEQFTPGSDFRAWANQIARYEVMKFRTRARGSSTAVQLSDDVIELLASETEAHTDLLEKRRLALAQCLQRLSAADRDLIERRMRPRVTMAMISVEVGRPAGGLYKAFERIYRALHTCIDRSLSGKAGH